jgi:hypothetical protein
MELEKPRIENVALGAGIFLVAAVVAFSAVQDRYSYTESIDTRAEINSSSNVDTVEFFNHSVDLMLEDSADATFYLDIDRDGSADEVIGRNSSASVRQVTELVDFEDGVYRLYIRYQDDNEAEGDAWLQVYRVEKLGR